MIALTIYTSAFFAVVYFLLCYAFTTLSRRLEKRPAWTKRSDLRSPVLP